MGSTHNVLGSAVHATRGVLLWICSLALASVLAWAMGAGVAEVPVVAEPSASSNSCDLSGHRLLYAGLNTWVPAEPRLVPCPNGGA